MNNFITDNINISEDLRSIARKVYDNIRISTQEALILFENAELGFLGILADYIRKQKHGSNTYFIRNFHIEPSNVCVYNCKFCSFSDKQLNHSWDYSIDEIIQSIKKYDPLQVREIHITGSANPGRDISYYIDLLKAVKSILPDVNIKAYSAVEIYYIAIKSGLSYKDVLIRLKDAGLNALPGGGAEIFDEQIRSEICPDKVTSSEWLTIHENAHNLGITTNATMLYGHIENYKHRIDHLERLRNLQDKTNGFGAFIPLKFKNKNNAMSDIKECSVIEDLRNYAVSRIFLDNFPHIKAYWPMLGRSLTQLTLSFGVDDIDGTIEDSTKIYSLAGAEDKNPDMDVNEMIQLIKAARHTAVER